MPYASDLGTLVIAFQLIFTPSPSEETNFGILPGDMVSP